MKTVNGGNIKSYPRKTTLVKIANGNGEGVKIIYRSHTTNKTFNGLYELQIKVGKVLAVTESYSLKETWPNNRK